MNYIQEINQFFIRTETNPVTASAATLWHTLMHVNNRAKWVSEFSTAASVLCAKSGLSPSAFKRARTELKEKGYIQVTSRGTKAPVYKITSLVDLTVDTSVTTSVKVGEDTSQVVDQVDILGQKLKEMNQDVDQEPGPLYKQNNIKQNKLKVSSTTRRFASFQFYQDNFGTVTDYIQRELEEWIEQLGDDMVYEALKRAADNGKATWRYVKGILKKWQTDGVTTTLDILIAEDKFRKQRTAQECRQSTGTLRPNHRRKEVIPDWFREDRRKKGIIV